MKTPIEILKKYWNYSSFRKPQEEIIKVALQHKNTIVLLPTGGGKSLCFQIPALIQEGICIVISPLIALINDQVNQLKKQQIKAIALTSQLNLDETIIAFDNLQFGDYKFLYVSPEKLQNPLIQEKIKQLNVSLIAIDEAHCISEWGHDFRPSYLKLKLLKEISPNATIMALTATATPKVLTDIQHNLEIENAQIFKKSFKRANLKFKVINSEDVYGQLIQLLQKIKGSIIIYAGTRKQTKEISTFLNKNGFKSNYYHGGMSTIDKNLAYENWMNDQIPIIVATNAFGMGINKLNVRAVIHINTPNSLENYIQEAGRAGRDEKMSDAIIISNTGIITETIHQFKLNVATIDFIKDIYKNLHQFYKISIGEMPTEIFNFSLQEFCFHYKLPLLKTYNAIKVLACENIIFLDEYFTKKTTIKFIINSKQVFNYIDKKPSKQQLINLLLRSYGGVFDHYTIINEYFLSKKLNCSTKELIHQLKEIAINKIIDYQHSNNTTKLSFLVARDDNYIINSISKHVKQQHQLKAEKLNAVINYIQNNTGCRTIQLLDYFGETLTKSCGICDVCEQKNKPIFNLEEISKQVELLLLKQSLSSSEIIQKLAVPKEEILISLKKLLDENKIAINSQNKFKASS